MRQIRLSTLLIAVNVGLLLLAVAGVSVVAVRLLTQLADEQALARVEQAGLIARQQVNSAGATLQTSAQLLSERPTLRRLLEQRDSAGLAAFLRQFQQTSQLDGTAVLQNGQVIVQSGGALPWPSLWAARRPNGSYTLYRGDNGSPLLLGAWATIPGSSGQVVGVVQQLDSAFAQQISARIGLPVTITPWPAVPSASSGTHAALQARALTTTTAATARLDDLGSYVAIVPLQTSAGTTLGLIETRLATASVSTSLQQLVQTLVALALAVVAVVVLASLALGQRLSSPLRRLTRAAARIGRGDLQTPIPVAPSAEMGTLSTTLEDMRWRLLHLTADLRRQQADVEAIINGIVEGVFSVDRERRIRYLNPQAAALLGTTSEAAIGRFCGDVLHPEGPNGVRPCAEHCPIVHARFRGGARATEHLRLPDGQRRTVAITSAPAVGGMQMQVLRDETEIEATRRLRDTILTNISHEFRTPLSAQLASIELLLDQLPELTIAQIEQLVRSQQRGTLRLTQLIDNLLESARIEAGQNRIRQQPVALDEVVEEALELTRPLLDQREQMALVELPYPLPPICGDAGRLTQVFVNLLGNANKYAPARSTIEIGGVVDDGQVRIWVQDHGPGMPANNEQGLFSPFVRAVQDEPEQSGFGLGLWLVKSIVERHGGSVDAQSNGDGTRISVRLPVEHHDENPDR